MLQAQLLVPDLEQQYRRIGSDARKRRGCFSRGPASRRGRRGGTKGRLRTRQRIENPRALKKEKTKWHQNAQTQRARSAGRDRPRRNLDREETEESHAETDEETFSACKGDQPLTIG